MTVSSYLEPRGLRLLIEEIQGSYGRQTPRLEISEDGFVYLFFSWPRFKSAALKIPYNPQKLEKGKYDLYDLIDKNSEELLKDIKLEPKLRMLRAFCQAHDNKKNPHWYSFPTFYENLMQIAISPLCTIERLKEIIELYENLELSEELNLPRVDKYGRILGKEKVISIPKSKKRPPQPKDPTEVMALLRKEFRKFEEIEELADERAVQLLAEIALAEQREEELKNQSKDFYTALIESLTTLAKIK